MALENRVQLGETFDCYANGTSERLILENVNNQGPNRGPVLSVEFEQHGTAKGSVYLTREGVADLATSLLFWLDQTDPDKEAQ